MSSESELKESESESGPTTQWPIERATSMLAGSAVLASLIMGRLHSRRWRLLTSVIGANLIMNALVGWCPATLVMRRLGIPTADQCSRR